MRYDNNNTLRDLGLNPNRSSVLNEIFGFEYNSGDEDYPEDEDYLEDEELV